MSDERVTPGNWFAIGIYAGPSPLALSPAPGARNPVLTYRDIDVPTIFVADPFLFRHDGAWTMLFEVMTEHTYKAEIALAVSGDGLAWEYRGIVLAEPFHLSYPQVFRWRGEIYLLPECYEDDRLRIYRAEPFPTRWRQVATLFEGERFADATIVRHGGRWWLFASEPRTNAVLRLFFADDLPGPWHEHPRSPIVAGDPCAARPAGPLVPWRGGLVRYAQVCAPRYGSAVRAFEITTLTPDDYAERPVPEPPLAPPEAAAWNGVAMHHVSAVPLADGSWLAAVDGHDHPSYRETPGTEAGRYGRPS